ncbi:MAG: hypothetical protein HY226_01415 [Candidatus Vogelbacteria bacterium]|nr:hypothetical protein [Candidatus Vogelbacteria bacterium]
MSEGSDYDPGPWKGETFADARKDYDAFIGRSYANAVNTGKKVEDVKVPTVEASCESPLIIAADETGSVGDWIAPIFAKLGFIVNEAPTYLGKDMQISFCAFGDAYCNERYPLQVRPFADGLALKDRLKELVIEQGGGGNGGESSELAALYYARNCKTPKAIRKPIIVFITDEQPHSPVDPKLAERWTGVKLEGSLTAKQVFEELKKKFEVYVVLKPYSPGAPDDNPGNRGIYDIWVDLLGFKNVKILPEADRVGDVILGILAEATDKNDEFRDDMEKRQTKVQQKTVYKSLGLNEDGTPKDNEKDEGKKTGGSKSVLRVPPKKKDKPGKLY